MDLKALRLQKSHANLQRRWREAYLAELRPDLAAFLAERPFLTAPDTDALVHRFGLPGTSEVPSEHRYSEVHRPEEVLQLASAVPGYDAGAWLMPSGYSKPYGDEHGVAFDVPFEWGLHYAEALWPKRHWGRPGFNLIAQDGSVGVLIEEWGARSEDQSPTDEVFGVRIWPVS